MIKINVPVKKVFPDPRSEKSLKLHLKEFIIYFKELEKFKKSLKSLKKLFIIVIIIVLLLLLIIIIIIIVIKMIVII